MTAGAEADAEMMCFEDKGRSHEPGNIGELEQARQWVKFSPEASKRNITLLTL